MRKLLILFVALPVLGIGTCLVGCNVDGKGNWNIAQTSSFSIGFEEDAPGDGQPATTNLTPLTEAVGSIAALWDDQSSDAEPVPPPGG